MNDAKPVIHKPAPKSGIVHMQEKGTKSVPITKPSNKK